MSLYRAIGLKGGNRMLQRRNEIFFGIFIAIIILVFIGASFHYSAKARMVPLVVGFSSLGLVLYQIFADVTARKSKREKEERLVQAKVIYAIAFAVGYGILVLLFGYFGSMGIAMIWLTRCWFKESWLSAFTTTACLLLFSYLLFTILFAIDLYAGIIPSFVISLLPD